MLRMSHAQAKLALSRAGGNSERRGNDCRGDDCRVDVIDWRPLFGIKSFENRDIPWAGWMARLR